MSRQDASGQDGSGHGDVPVTGWVRDVLRCPACGSPLRDGRRPDGAAELVCTGRTCALAYPVRDGIPVLLVDEAYPAAGTV